MRDVSHCHPKQGTTGEGRVGERWDYKTDSCSSPTSSTKRLLNWLSPAVWDDSAALMQHPESPLACRQPLCRCLPGLWAAAGEEMPPLNSSQQSPSGNCDSLNTRPASLLLREHGERHEPPRSPCAARGDVKPEEETPLLKHAYVTLPSPERETSTWHFHACHSPWSETLFIEANCKTNGLLCPSPLFAALRYNDYRSTFMNCTSSKRRPTMLYIIVSHKANTEISNCLIFYLKKFL